MKWGRHANYLGLLKKNRKDIYFLERKAIILNKLATPIPNLRMGEQAVEDGLAIPLRSFSNHLTGLGEKTS